MALHMPPSSVPPPSQDSAMDITSGGGSMGPPYNHSLGPVMGTTESPSNGSLGSGSGAAAMSQQPKVVQTAFIHKLYNMLEDNNIQHLITWSNSNDSFLISPTADFSKVLATYFKHTNVSSFVRQLNMYGFHKVSDVFHTGSPESPLWEFKHGNGSFRRGDFAGLKEIKRRASRHTLIHRDSFPSVAKPLQLPMGPPVETVPDSLEGRLGLLEHALYEMQSRLARAEESNAFMVSKCQGLTENLMRSYQYNHDISSILLNIITDSDSLTQREVLNMQLDISRQLDVLRNMDHIHQIEPARNRHPSFAQSHFENGTPMSPFQLAQDDQRRASLFNTMRPGFFRPAMPHRAATESIRRYDLAGGRSSSPPLPAPIPTSLERPVPAVAEQQQPPLPNIHNISPPAYLSRRHTSADIRQPGWLSAVNSNDHLPLPGGQQSPYASGQSSANWPSSPQRTPNPNAGEQQLRDTLARYQLSGNDSRLSAPGVQPPPIHGTAPAQHSRHPSPPAPNEMVSGGPSQQTSNNGAGAVEGTVWSFGSRLPFKDVFSSSGTPTRRGSVAHLLNPAETAERSDEDDVGPDDLRKRKRLG